jgi:CHAT domain-containing protein/uncharacterized protein HemY
MRHLLQCMCLSFLYLGLLMGPSGGVATTSAAQEQASATPPWTEQTTPRKTPQTFERGGLLKQGQRAQRTANYSKALEKYEEGLKRAQASGNERMVARFLTGIGTTYRDLTEYDKALQYLEQALAASRSIRDRQGEGRELGSISSVYQLLAQYDKALQIREQALAIRRETRDRKGEGADLHNMGIVYRQFGYYQKALEYYNQALPIMRETKNRLGESSALSSLGDVYCLLGQYEKALQVLQQSMAIAEEIGHRKGKANVLATMGTVHRRLGQYGRALQYHQRCLTIRKETENRRGEAAALSLIGNDYMNLQQFNQALQAFEPALTITREIKDRRGESDALSNMGSVYNGLGQYEKALQYQEQALAIKREIKDLRGEGMALIGIGFSCRQLGRQDRALQALNQSLRIFQEMGAPEFLWRAQRGLASVEATMGKNEEALAHYEQALDTIESIRGELSEEAAKATFMRDKLRVYDELIILLQTMYAKSPAKGYDRKSLEIFERKQGRVFLEEIGKSGARNFAGLPEAVRNRESELEDRLTELRSAVADERSKSTKGQTSPSVRALQQQITQVKSAAANLREEIKAGYPDYYALKYPRPATLSELQDRVLKPGEVILVYGVLENATCLWVIAKDQFKLFSVGVGEKELANRISTFRQGLDVVLEAVQRKESVESFSKILQSSLKDLQQNGRGLYALLFPEGARPIVAQAGTLYVVPTGSLYGLPFEALVTAGKSAEKDLHYLVESHSIGYLSSASLLKILRDAKLRRKEPAQFPLLAFANPTYGGTKISLPKGIPLRAGDADEAGIPAGDAAMTDMRARSYMQLMGGGFVELPETEDEAKEIKSILAAPDQSHPLQLREAASRSNILRYNKENKLGGYRYLVFACHGVIPGEMDPVTQPALVLSHPDPSTKGEGFLTMADVFGLQLNADLVTLSACNTGRGKTRRGEGVIGLTRAFMYAGTPAISVTLWSVESKSARVLSTGFYENLKSGKSRAESLRTSKLRMIRSEAGEYYHHPFFWAPVVVFGDGG